MQLLFKNMCERYAVIVLLCLFISCDVTLAVGKVKTVQSIKNKTNEFVKSKQQANNNTSSNENSTVPKVEVQLPKKTANILKMNRLATKMITPEMIKEWATKISKGLLEHEEIVVRRKVILKNFSNVKTETRNGSAIADRIVTVMEDLLKRRAVAAENIMRKAEELASNWSNEDKPPEQYMFDASKNLGVIKPTLENVVENEYPLSCRSLQRVKIAKSSHFDADVTLEASSVHVAAEVFDCDTKVVDALYYTEELLQTFRNNYAQDASTGFQYFCSAQGFLRHYPAASWESMRRLQLKDEDEHDVYDCRLRQWYVSASGAPRDILILIDASGSMANIANNVVAEIFTLALLSALTDDDRVNVLRYNAQRDIAHIKSPIECFDDKLVSANHVNTAAILDAIKSYKVINTTLTDKALEFAVKLLQNYNVKSDQPPSCQQAIVLVTDSLYYDHTELMNTIDPEGKIRLFVLWLHDKHGLRDNTLEVGELLSCSRDGSFAELLTHSDVTLQVMRLLRVLERPLVAQRKERLKVFSDLYAHMEDPRRGEYHWREKENAEQLYRYRELRRDKDRLMNSSQLTKDYMDHLSLENYGQYYEEENVKYRFQISVSVPVFEHTLFENITIQLMEEKQRNSTREYPVNRLLGVAGVDIPIDHLKLILPYYELGPGAAILLLDHRGNVVLHDNIKPLLDGDILKPGYRTVDFLELEQAATDHRPRHYPANWLSFRRTMLIDQPKGARVMFSKNIFDYGMRAFLEQREYHWRRIVEHYTAVVILPTYGRQYMVPETTFTQKIAGDALKALSGTDYTIHPDWLYCRHTEPYFDTREAEVLHFLRRRRDEPNFIMEHLNHHFTSLPPTVLERTYKCEEKLITRLCFEAIATEQWAREHEEPGTRDCGLCRLGSTTAFFATESGLTRWQLYHATSGHVAPPEGSVWPQGPTEAWYRRAAALPGTLVVHAPSLPVRRMRNLGITPTPVGDRGKWLTAARTLVVPGKGNLGVAGFHFYPSHLEEMFEGVTNFPCSEVDEEKCEARCDGETWSCVLIDDGGWVVAGGKEMEEDQRIGDGVRQHLSTLYPGVMAALLNASVFKLRWIHDYQAVCFIDEDKPDAAPIISSMLQFFSQTVKLMLQMTANTISCLSLLFATRSAQADTQAERDKRRKRLRKDNEREKFENLYDDRVLVNRTKFAACDRSRAFYEYQRTSVAAAALSRPSELCSWPLVAAPVEQTNLLLIAVYTLCPENEWPIPNNPLINQVVNMHDVNESPNMSPANRLACWRNRVPLPGRSPATVCFPHNFKQEDGYRQCGPWLPNPDQD